MSKFFVLFFGIAAVVSAAAVCASFVPPQTDFSFVSDVEVTWRGRSSVARMFVDERTKECRLVTPNLTSMLFARGFSEVQVQSCSSGAFSARVATLSTLDEESQVLARVCGALSWPSATEWASKDWTEKQITRVPVFTNVDKKCGLAANAACDCTCEYAFDHNDWVGESRQALRAVSISGCPATCGFPDAYVSIMSYWRLSIPPTLLTPSCQETSINYINPRDKWGSLLNEVGFPELPSEFSALFKVTLVEYGVNVEFHETFSAPLRAARATVFTARETAAGDIATAETFLTHGTAGVTFRVQHDVMAGSMQTLASQGAYSCQQMVYKSEIFASSVESLLMVPATFPPVPLGNYTVRGIPCVMWGQSVSEDLRIEWYFPHDSAVTAATGNSAHEGRPSHIADKVLPRRIVLRGAGRSPFFTNHPFVPKSIELPNGDTDYCDRIPFFYNPHCLSTSESNIDAADQFEHVIDIAEMPSAHARNRSVFAAPEDCIGASLVRGSTCDGVSPGLVVVLAILSAICGASLTRCLCPGSNDDLFGKDKNQQQQQQQQQDEQLHSESPGGGAGRFPAPCARRDGGGGGGDDDDGSPTIGQPSRNPVPTARL